VIQRFGGKALALALVTAGCALTPTPALAQQSCPAAGMQFDHHNKYEGTVYTKDNGWVRLTSKGGLVDYSNRCHYSDAAGQLWKLDVGTPLRKVAAGTPPPAKPAEPALAGPIANGVYECDSPQMIGGMVMPSPSTGHMFGVTGPGTYRDFNGGRGSFSFAAGILTMTSGPLKGIRYRREAATLFYPLNAKGERGSIRCVLNRSKSLTGRW
jgi:hypothetical protein